MWRQIEENLTINISFLTQIISSIAVDENTFFFINMFCAKLRNSSE